MTESSTRRFNARSLLARGLLIATALVIASQLMPQIPREQTLVLRLPQAPSVRVVELSWTKVGDADPLGGATFRFDRGAPAQFEHRLQVPNGRYDVDVNVLFDADSEAHGRQSTYHRRVTLEGDITNLSLRELP